MATKTTRIGMALAAVLALGAAAYGQDGRWQRGDRDHDRDDRYRQGYGWGHDRDDARFYQRGFKDGSNDARHGRPPRASNRRINQRDDRQAYLAGYRDGYAQYGGRYRYPGGGPGYPGGYGNPRGGYGYPGGGYGYPGGGYGNGPDRGVGNQAYQIGYQDGLRHGQNDRRTGHSYRPTEDGDYKDADRGYSSSYGNKQAYKDQYRNGYRAGYDRGYRSGF